MIVQSTRVTPGQDSPSLSIQSNFNSIQYKHIFRDADPDSLKVIFPWCHPNI